MKFFLLLLFFCSSVYAGFEGTIEMKIGAIDKGGNAISAGMGKILFALSPEGSRQDMNVNTPIGEMTTIKISRKDRPDVIYDLNVKNKTYTESLKKEVIEKGTTPNVKKTGKKQLIQGYNAEEVLVTNKNSTAELWVTTEISDDGTIPAYSSAAQDSFKKALKEAGLDKGFPLKMIHTTKEGIKVTMETIKVEKKKLPKSLFEIPADYKKSENAPMMPQKGGVPNKEAMKKMLEEQMKNMPPEQQEQIRKMLDKMK